MSANPLDNCSEADLKRFAACWLNSSRTETDWTAAAQQYDSTVQVASFKTVTGRAAVKVLKGTPGEGEAKPAAKKAAGGKRKKAAAEEEGADGEEEKPKAKKGKGGAKGKTAKSPAAVTEEEEGEKDEEVKAEEKEENEELV